MPQNVELPDIKTLGTYDATVKLHPEVSEPRSFKARSYMYNYLCCCHMYILHRVFSSYKDWCLQE